jgi:hypothetical protein
VAQRRSTKHTPRIDDEMQHDVRSLIEGNPVESRSQEQRLQEDPGLHAATRPGTDRVADQVSESEIELRAELARSLKPSVFPGDRDRLLEAALDQQAPDDIVELIRRLPEGVVFDHFESAWEALGGHTERGHTERGYTGSERGDVERP